jgi:hypothetical protein
MHTDVFSLQVKRIDPNFTAAMKKKALRIKGDE